MRQILLLNALKNYKSSSVTLGELLQFAVFLFATPTPFSLPAPHLRRHQAAGFGLVTVDNGQNLCIIEHMGILRYRGCRALRDVHDIDRYRRFTRIGHKSVSICIRYGADIDSWKRFVDVIYT